MFFVVVDVDVDFSVVGDLNVVNADLFAQFVCFSLPCSFHLINKMMN